MPCPFSGDESEATIQWVRRAEAALGLIRELADSSDMPFLEIEEAQGALRNIFEISCKALQQ